MSELLRTSITILSVPLLLNLAALAYEPPDQSGEKTKTKTKKRGEYSVIIQQNPLQEQRELAHIYQGCVLRTIMEVSWTPRPGLPLTPRLPSTIRWPAWSLCNILERGLRCLLVCMDLRVTVLFPYLF